MNTDESQPMRNKEGQLMYHGFWILRMLEAVRSNGLGWVWVALDPFYIYRPEDYTDKRYFPSY